MSVCRIRKCFVSVSWLDVPHGLIWKYLLCVAHSPPKNGDGEPFQAPEDEGGFYYYSTL